MKDYKKWIKRIALQMRAKLQLMEAQSVCCKIKM